MYIGIDVGGTNLKAGVVDETGRLVCAKWVPLDFQGPEGFAKTLADLSAAAAEEAGIDPMDIASVGVGLPGAVEGGRIVYTTNIPMADVPLEALFRKHLDRPLLLGNDADCAAVGEFFCGAGRGCRDFAVITLGTGIGGGIIIDGKLRGGPASSEAGHLVIIHGGEPCNCGRRGCWERYASATALVQQARKAMECHPESAMHRLERHSGALEGRTVFQAAQEGDGTALAVCRQYADFLSGGLISLINILRPERVALGGGIAAAPEELLLGPVRQRVERESFAIHGGRRSEICRAELGNDAGMIGAALLSKVI